MTAKLEIVSSGKFLLLKSGILSFGIRNSSQGIRDPALNEWSQSPLLLVLD